MQPKAIPEEPIVVAGIDVGGERKGFHAVALRKRVLFGQFASADPAAVADWCREIGAMVIGVDAPCRWHQSGTTRVAETGLKREGGQCFSTPTYEAAIAHPLNHYGWMLNGAKLFDQLETSHRLFGGNTAELSGPVCFETFPQVIACALAGEIVSAKQKGRIRRELLIEAGIDISALSNIDKVDAALCALSARSLAISKFKAYGEAVSGFIVVPGETLSR